MRKLIGLLICFGFALSAQGQYKVQFILKEKTAIQHDSIYITGSFNNWDSIPNKDYLLKPTGENEKSIVLNLPKGTFNYKFHRGTWFTVEKQYDGNEVADRTVNINSDTTLTDSVLSWRDELLWDKKYALRQQQQDTSRVSLLAAIAYNYAFWAENYNSDSALFYANEALQLQQQIIKSGEYKKWKGEGQSQKLFFLQEMLASLFHSLGNYPKALEIRLENLNLAEKEKDKFFMVTALINITNDYNSMYDYENALRYGKLMDSVLYTLDTNDQRYTFVQSQAKSIIANAFYNLNNTDSALFYAKIRAKIQNNNPDIDSAFSNLLLGKIYAKKGDDAIAFSYYRQVYPNALQIYNPQVGASGFEGMARLFQKQGQLDSALYYAKRAFTLLQNYKTTVMSWGENSDAYVAEISPLIAELYKATNEPDSAYKYLKLSITLKDRYYNTGKLRQFQTLSFNETTRRQQLEQQNKEAQLRYRTQLKMYGLIAGMVIFLVIVFILYRNNKQKQTANNLLKVQKQEIVNTLGELKNTQAQLIQSEKMASLGELTAGIAHEIQNPLNFVNNFSEVNKELIGELKEEVEKGNLEEVKAIASDIEANEKKINHHGKRADAIVKGMLQHSRTNEGKKEPTDINALADEYLRLSYHGLRAKDKSFNADFKMEFDDTLPKINAIPQEIGRVLLNLINNAFYAVSSEALAKGDRSSKPMVTVRTKKLDIEIEITVKDNGGGIPADVRDKIFQPFFTTKPTGQGTGLGLSLSYDIITKGHGGRIKVTSIENEGAEFIIHLPI